MEKVGVSMLGESSYGNYNNLSTATIAIKNNQLINGTYTIVKL